MFCIPAHFNYANTIGIQFQPTLSGKKKMISLNIWRLDHASLDFMQWVTFEQYILELLVKQTVAVLNSFSFCD